MSDPFLGEIRMISWNFPPRYWAMCDGAMMAIAQNQALFALLGTTYGGDGVRTYQLPDLRALAPMGMGAAGVGPAVTMGVPSVTLGPLQVPAHTHVMQAAKTPGTVAAMVAGTTVAGFNNAYGKNPGPGANQVQFPAADIGTVGAGAAHENRQPFLCINFAIALSGIFPSRN